MSLDTRITLHKLEVFCLVVELGGIGKAAKHLYLAQPVVSTHIRDLQKRLGVVLMERNGRHLEVNEAGTAVYEWARTTLTRGHELTRELENLVSGQGGRAVIAATTSLGSYLLPSLLTTFQETRPGCLISLDVADPEQVLERVQSGVADFGLLPSAEAPDPVHFEATELGHEPIILVAAPGHAPATDHITTDELAQLPHLSSQRGNARRDIVDAALRQIGVEVGPVMLELGNPEASKLAVGQGSGVTFLFRHSVLAELESGQLRQITFDGSDRLTTRIFLVTRREKRMSALQRELADHLRSTVQVELAAA